MVAAFFGAMVRTGDLQLGPSVHQYAMVRDNANLLNIVHVGPAFLNENGKPASQCFTRRFNFKLCLERDQRAKNSTRLLTESDMEFKRREGIDPNEFAQLFTTSGLVLSENGRWLTGRAYFSLWNARLVFTCCPGPSYHMADEDERCDELSDPDTLLLRDDSSLPDDFIDEKPPESQDGDHLPWDRRWSREGSQSRLEGGECRLARLGYTGEGSPVR